MWNRIKALFDRPDASQTTLPQADRLQLAAASLMIEIARMDDVITEDERARIRSLVRDRFTLSAEEAEALVAEAERATESSTQWYGFTSKLIDGFDYDERVKLVEMLWEVVYADGTLHHLESNLMRRLGGLLGVTDRDRGDALRRVKARLGVG